jgi:YVTN family beta-propeller protein
MRPAGLAAAIAAALAWQMAPAVAAQHYADQGVAMDVEIEPLGTPRAGLDVRLSVHLSDAATGAPLVAASPAAWVSPNRRGTPADELSCRRKVAAFLGSNPLSRPEVDLTGFTLIAMNHDASITVIDPQGGYGGSRMIAMLPLDSPGADWAVGRDPPRLYVTEPATSRLAVIDTERWQRAASIALPDPPSQVLLQHDGRYLWIAAASNGAVVSLATDSMALAARILVGRGAHRIAITRDDRRLLVTNQDDGTVSVIDVGALTRVGNISVGTAPRAIAVSALASFAYVAVDDSIAVLDPSRDILLARIDKVSGATALGIAPDGRWGFATSPAQDRVTIFDTVTNRQAQSLAVADKPYEIAFTDTEAYIRRRDSEAVTLVPLAPLRSDGKTTGLAEIPAGEKPVAEEAGEARFAASMAASPGEAAILLASPAEHAIHYYHEGMAAPADSFDDLGHQPVAVAIADHSLRQTVRGTYSAVARLPHAGVYDLVVLLDSPRVAHCFVLNAHAGSDGLPGALTLEPVKLPHVVPAGVPLVLAFRVAGSSKQKAADEPAGMTALAILAPGSWFERVPMTQAQDGTWRLQFTPPRAGVYLLTFEAPALDLDVSTSPHFTVEAAEPPESDARHD